MKYFVTDHRFTFRMAGEVVSVKASLPRATVKGAVDYCIERQKLDPLSFMLNLEQYILIVLEREPLTKHMPKYKILSITPLGEHYNGNPS